ncbi:hypothetical protein [Actinokineospora iranica]|uniref:Uncharacterized protein n=1 Tax=Actinokineospora iranica TaxID=1271860 RepID=A0A1G6WHB4_9PSEU|nr:hypothetical protein [Actinokineospora iranica]SDD65201.1 hypothetical protein SAMN05216174_1154 [Actinokineospora iranica]
MSIPAGNPVTDPVARYKELLDAAHKAARKHTEHERKRAIDLVAEIREANQRVTAATEAEAQVTGEINAWWRGVVDRLDTLRWITPGPRPAPDVSARPELLREYLAEIEPATKAFYAALRRAAWPKRL